MPWIVDGHNLIPKIPGMSLSMLDDEEQLIELLNQFTRVTKKKLLVYFDKAPPGMNNVQRFGFVSAYFVREGRSADSAIISKLKQLGKSAKNWTVVSSDREIRSEARSVGATVISSEEFARLIFSVGDDTGKSPDVSDEVYPDDHEVKHWLKRFQERGDDISGE